MPEVKTTITEMNDAFDGLFSRLYMAKNRISELENRSTETSEKKKKLKKNKTEKSRTEDPSLGYSRPNIQLWDN